LFPGGVHASGPLSAARQALPYVFAVVFTLAAVGARYLLQPWLGIDYLPLVTLFAAVAAAEWIGGVWAAALSAVVGYLACDYLFIGPPATFGWFQSPQQTIGALAFFLSSGIIVAFGEALRASHGRERSAMREAQRLAHLGAWERDLAGDTITVSDEFLRIFGLPARFSMPAFHELDGTLYTHESWLALDTALLEARTTGAGFALDLEGRRGGAGERIWLSVRGEAVRDRRGVLKGLRGTVQDITGRKRGEAWQAGQRRVLEKIARRVPLRDVLEEIALTVQEQDPGLVCSIHLIDQDSDGGAHLRVGAGPSLPEEYLRAMDGAPLDDERAGPCCQALMRDRDVLVPDITADAGWSDTWRKRALASGLRSCRSSIVRAVDGRPLATFAMYRRHAGDPQPANLQVPEVARQLVAIAVERDSTDAEVRQAEADVRLLQSLGAALVHGDGEPGFYGMVIDGAARLMRSQFASMQALETAPDGNAELRLLAHRGFNARAMKEWERVRLDSATTCGEALRTARRCVVTDVSACGLLKGTLDLVTYLENGIRSVQTTPLVSRTGRLIGMLSTHWDRPYNPPERDLRNLDILARQAADLIERKRNEDALREADRRKDEFLATLAHELRNPLAPMRNALAVMRLPGGRQADRPREIIERQLSHLIRLVDDLLDVSRITRGTIPLRRIAIDLAAVIRQAVETARPLAEERGHELQVRLPNEPIYVDADPVRLAQVFNNLLNNACKYTEPGGRIELLAEQQDGEVVVTVRDNGVGIPGDRLDSIFDMFTQVDRSLERTQGGLGIGLTLVRRLVQEHGGRVVARSDGEGRGSEFEVRLPVLEVAPDAASTEYPAAVSRPGAPVSSVATLPVAGNGHRTGPRRRALVVDDNVDSAESLAILLEATGNETRTAHDGREAIAAAEAFKPQVVFLDIGMPHLNGYDTARRIREQPWGRNIVLVAVTGWGQEEDRRRSKDAGFDAHLVKPADYTEVSRLLASVRGHPGNGGGDAQRTP
jgi:signal transduction histidine kinase/ActR/RegA family two-component response regulator/PAS domain-containing protein